MENLAVAILIYVAIVAIAYCPAKTTATDPVTEPVDYFPDLPPHLEADLYSDPADEDPEVIIPVAKPAKKAKTLAELIKTEVSRQSIPAPAPASTQDLSEMGVRELYKLASQAGIKGYKSMSKKSLISALA